MRTAAVLLAAALGCGAPERAPDRQMNAPAIPALDAAAPARTETATFALGCFWCPDAQFGILPGVVRTRVGYAGGTTENPTYHDLGDHTECVQIDYDPRALSFDQVLDHDGVESCLTTCSVCAGSSRVTVFGSRSSRMPR